MKNKEAAVLAVAIVLTASASFIACRILRPDADESPFDYMHAINGAAG
ncbi:MAG: hypothetical protein LBT41_06375 [Candidatus Methanoplasma sp.]|jgi:hypothetical protein|nr:hypothetical protein [Candidatus Methanoplasma sp.]